MLSDLRERVDGVILAVVVSNIIMWEIAGHWFNYPFLPPFSDVIQASVEMILSGEITSNLIISLANLVVGYVIAAVLGIILGTVMGLYRQVEYFFDIYIEAFLAAPTLIYVPILYAIFGVSRWTQVGVVFLYAFFIITLNTQAGVRRVNQDWIDMAKAYGAEDRQLLWTVVLPASFPLMLSGLRAGLARGMKGMINGEMFIALVGLGALLQRYGGRFDTEHVLGILLLIIVLFLLIMALFGLVERRLLRWVAPWEVKGNQDDLVR